MGMFDASKRATATVDDKGPGKKPEEATAQPGAGSNAQDTQWQEHHSHQAEFHKARAGHHEALAATHTKAAATHHKEVAYHQGKL
jgi:hypothetical protein